MVAQYEGGDHTLFLGEVIDLHYNDTAGADGQESQPLLYFRSRYCSTNAEPCLSKSN